jgi:hypothetical protein
MRGKKKRTSRRIAFAIVLAMLASLIVVPAPAMAAAGSFTGGPDQFPLYVANDLTPIAVHFSTDASSGLLPNTSYYLKLRLTVGTSPAGTTNRGYTWNATTGRWVQEREDWTLFPQVTTNASGTIDSSSGWAFFKFGDDTKAGPYHVMISLSSVGLASTFNGSYVPTVTVFDPRVDGSWVHNGVATGRAASKNARVTDETSSTVLSLQKTEAQGVDDDANGIVDDEDYGPAGNAGDFRMAVPASTVIKVNLNQSFWPSTTATFTSGPADTDIALGASDMVAPTRPGTVSAASGDGTASIAWTPATDDTAVSGYYVYRWEAAPQGAAYSPVHARVATLAPDATSYGQAGLTNGTTYFYEVRAFDAATNIGPRSNTVAVTPQTASPGASVSPASPDGFEGWYRTHPVVTLATTSGRTTQYSYEASPSVWTTYTVPVSIPDGVRTLYYRDTDGSTASAVQHLDFLVDTTAPKATLSAPTFSTQVTASRNFKVSWSASDSGSGVARYDVDFKTGASGTWTRYLSTAATSTIFPGSAGATYYLRVSATDVAGNTNSPVTSSGTSVPYDQNKASFSHGWSTYSSSSRYGGSVKYTTHSGGYANFTLSKGVLYLVATTSPKMGKVAVYYRGRRVTTIDTYSKTTKYRQTFKIATYAKGAKPSAVKLVNLATSHRPRVEIDGFALRY